MVTVSVQISVPKIEGQNHKKGSETRNKTKKKREELYVKKS